MIGAAAAARRNSRCPFTAAQWQEFEHQALIYKYMLSGVTVPPQLLLSIKPPIHYSPTSSLFPTHPTTFSGWDENEIVAAANAGGGLSYGWGGKRIDPEPGRCRRTDGKKWRCSKEAHPESRYCERHMHRGRNKTNNSCSRKPVEFQFSTAPPTTSTTPPPAPPTTTMSLPIYSSSVIPPSLHHDYQNTPLLYPSFRSSSSSRPSPPTQPTIPFSQHHKDHRYEQGMRKEIHEGDMERAAFPRDPYSPTTRMNQSHSFGFHSLLEDKSKHKQNEQEQRNCYVLGTNIKTSPTTTTSIGGLEGRGQDQDKPFHHFFSDWPPTSTQPSSSSRDAATSSIDDMVGNLVSNSSTGQLSLPMPLSTQDFFQSKPTTYW